MDITKFIDIKALISTIAGFIPQLLVALTIFLAFRFAYKASRKPIIKLLERIKLEGPIVTLLVDNIYKYTLLGFGAVMGLGQMGIDVGAVLAGLGVAGIAIGFAAQDSMSNIIAGFIIFLDKPFKVGDWVQLEDHYGKVHEITMRSTRIQTEQHTYVVVPNKTIIDEVVVNHSKYGQLMVEVPIGIAYHESIDDARKVLLHAIANINTVLTKPEPQVVVVELSDSSVVMQVEAWIDDAEEEEPTKDEILEVCKKALDEAGIEIPYPHVHLQLDEKQTVTMK